MESLKTALEKFIDHISNTANIYVSIIVIFCYHVVLKFDFQCTCKPGGSQCDVYMVIPCFILFLVILWTNTACQRALRYTCKTCSGTFCCVLVKNILKAACIGLLWVSSVYMDGDWFLCCKSNQTAEQIVLPCKAKNKSNLTPEEKEIITDIKNTSLELGLYVLLGICILAAFSSGIYSCLSSCCGCFQKLKNCCSGCCNTQHELNELILEEWENHLRDCVKEATGRTLTSKLETDWGTNGVTCVDYVDEIIRDPKLLIFPEPQQDGQIQQQQQQQQDDEQTPPPPKQDDKQTPPPPPQPGPGGQSSDDEPAADSGKLQNEDESRPLLTPPSPDEDNALLEEEERL
ncbi:uncharacterized protein LOC115361786 [Myripristis murdjan]|uniref:uncharacterized protein LOC115361786 n=1 Tax=Myripristis murdjan TaxID=586833 RepID=UPI0011763FFF|nr:uncharacterized protein LOC115361786 [Myripristis murdjan]